MFFLYCHYSIILSLFCFFFLSLEKILHWVWYLLRCLHYLSLKGFGNLYFFLWWHEEIAYPYLSVYRYCLQNSYVHCLLLLMFSVGWILNLFWPVVKVYYYLQDYVQIPLSHCSVFPILLVVWNWNLFWSLFKLIFYLYWHSLLSPHPNCLLLQILQADWIWSLFWWQFFIGF